MYKLQYLLGHKGKGSLFSYLRKRLWATELVAWTFYDMSNMGTNKIFSFFDINIYLTENGIDHLDDVISAIFSYLKFLQNAKISESIFWEIRTAGLNMNRHSRDIEALENVETITMNMLNYPSRYFITASGYEYAFDFDAVAVEEAIDFMNLRRFNIMIRLKRSKSERLLYNSVEPMFGIKYMEVDMPVKWIESHQKAEPFPEFALPETNPFFVDNFTILNTGGDGDSGPYTLLDNGFSELWYRNDNKISRVYAEFCLFLQKPHAETSIDK